MLNLPPWSALTAPDAGPVLFLFTATAPDGRISQTDALTIDAVNGRAWYAAGGPDGARSTWRGRPRKGSRIGREYAAVLVECWADLCADFPTVYRVYRAPAPRSLS